MTLDATVKTVLVATLLAIGIPGLFLSWSLPAPRLSATERELMNFSSKPLAMSPPSMQTVYPELQSPVRATSKPQTPVAGSMSRSFPPGKIPAASIAEDASKRRRGNSFDSHPVVSMIYTENSIKTAIIDGQVLHEGSVLRGNRIVKIEKTRVLMRAAGKDVWLKIE